MSIGRRPTQYEGVLPKNPPNVIFADRAPVDGTDKAFNPGDLWVDQDSLAVWQFAGVSGAIWIALGTGATGGVVTINGNAPTAGDYTLAGTANQITIAESSGTSTFTIPATFIAPGSISAASGNITATNGNIVRGTAGNKDVYSSVASTTTAGANSAGTVTLVGGTATVSTTAVTASSQIRLYRQGVGSTGAAALGILTLGAKTASTSFVINAVQAADATALQASDVSVIAWEIVN